MKKTPAYKLEDSLGHLATRFSRVILRRINAELSRRGHPVTSEQFSLLVHVWDQNGLPQGVLAEKTAKDKTTTARFAAGLEALGLIVRLPSPGDARERLIFLTDKGKVMMDEVTHLVQEVLDVAVAGIDAEELRICRDVLRRAHANLLK
jgi:DNA-binding MarR family transcriptional regulator